MRIVVPGQQPEPEPPANVPVWTAGPGWWGCPNQHTTMLGPKFCGDCGAGPVPSHIEWEANNQLAILNARAQQQHPGF
ncbi:MULTISPECIES: hypothetical protein [unclassified Microbacterium]|uniref:hypothetical protein n=1 Tax=unclassified Microbacterium TaxID=2609290 RepID=UPI000A5C9C7D|nr:hypothetical protein [Microbacterium sp. Leaf161]